MFISVFGRSWGQKAPQKHLWPLFLHTIPKLKRTSLSTELRSRWHMGDDDSEENPQIYGNRTLTQNHLDTLKITFESYWGVSCRYLMGNVAREERTACGRTALPQQRAEWLVAALLTARWDGLEELQQQRTGPIWLSDDRKWRAVTSPSGRPRVSPLGDFLAEFGEIYRPPRVTTRPAGVSAPSALEKETRKRALICCSLSPTSGTAPMSRVCRQ